MKFLTKNFKGENLRARVLRSSSITFVGYGLEQVLRLASNLILTRILFPEAFGIMALATTILVGLTMLSDLGIQHSLIQNKKGSENYFRDTAWVAQIFKGFLLWLFACLISYPIAIIYEAPVLFPLICALGSTLAIKGFNSTSIAISNKDLKIFKLSAVKLGTQSISIILTVIFAYYLNSIWALVWGNIISSIISVLAGHILLNNNYKHRFKVDMTSLRQIISFGKWIMISSMFGFLANQADKMIIGKMLSLTDLGIFTIAITLAQVPKALLQSLDRMVLFPVYSKMQDQNDDERTKKVFRSKILICSMLLPIAIVLLIWGDILVEFLYDSRYKDAGWMLQILAAGIAIEIVTNVGPYYLGLGKSNIFALLMGVKAFLLIVCMLIGGLMLGPPGLIMGISISSALYYLVEIKFMRKYKIWFWKFDSVLIFLIAFICFITYSNKFN